MSEMIFPNSFVRQFSGPLDNDLVFTNTTTRTNYLTSARRYPGQIVSDLQDGKAYKLNITGTVWEEFGSVNAYSGTDIKALTANWQNTYTNFSTQSAINISVYTTVQANSATDWTTRIKGGNAGTFTTGNITFSGLGDTSISQVGNTIIINSVAGSGGGGLIIPTSTVVVPSVNTSLPTSNDIVFNNQTQTVTITGFNNGVAGVLYTLTNKSTFEVTLSSSSRLFIRGGNAWAGYNCNSNPNGKIELPQNYSCSLRMDSATTGSVW